jgi:hypothetical protein
MPSIPLPVAGRLRMLWMPPDPPRPKVFAHCWRCNGRVEGSSDAMAIRLLEDHLRREHGES